MRADTRGRARGQRHFMIMVVVAATCVFVEPTSGIIVGILLSLGKGAFLESKAWVLCKLRQGDSVIAQFNCDLVRVQVLMSYTVTPSVGSQNDD